jgi:hypothetical protein
MVASSVIYYLLIPLYNLSKLFYNLAQTYFTTYERHRIGRAWQNLLYISMYVSSHLGEVEKGPL